MKLNLIIKENTNSMNIIERHSNIIDLLSCYSQYKNKIKKRSNIISTYKAHEELDIYDVNNAVCVLLDFLALSGGSVGSIDLYKLLQSYLLNEEKRDVINNIIKK